MSKLSQLDKLDVLIAAAQRARIAAEHNLLFADRKGVALINAAFDLFECDQLYDLARDIERDVCGPDESIPPLHPITTQIRKLNPSLFVDGEVR